MSTLTVPSFCDWPDQVSSALSLKKMSQVLARPAPPAPRLNILPVHNNSQALYLDTSSLQSLQPAEMAPYDSDSSGGEDDDFTETNVLLGYASKEASDDTISYLG